MNRCVLWFPLHWQSTLHRPEFDVLSCTLNRSMASGGEDERRVSGAIQYILKDLKMYICSSTGRQQQQGGKRFKE